MNGATQRGLGQVKKFISAEQKYLLWHFRFLGSDTPAFMDRIVGAYAFLADISLSEHQLLRMVNSQW